MRTRRASLLGIYLFGCFMLLAACTPSTHSASVLEPIPTRSLPETKATSTRIAVKPTVAAGSAMRYKARVLLAGGYRPDDLTFDLQGRLVFSDVYHGTINRLNANGSVTTLVRGIAGPEGLVFLANGTMIIAEQQTNRILALSASSSSLSVLRMLPGRPSTANCKDGIDGLALDATTQTLIVPDSPMGRVYRMSLDGKSMSLLASGITRPVGVAVDAQGNVFVADECGGALWEITPKGKITRTGGFGMLDDVAFDTYGNVLVTDLKPSIHALIRLNLTTGKRDTISSQGFIEPQGLAVDARGDIFLSDDYADKIVEYIPEVTS